MALPQVSREALIDAMGRFDVTRRAAYNFAANRYVIQFADQLYPPKEIISIATGRGVDTFSGGKAGANAYLVRRGFTVVDLAEVGRDALGLAS